MKIKPTISEVKKVSHDDYAFMGIKFGCCFAEPYSPLAFAYLLLLGSIWRTTFKDHGRSYTKKAFNRLPGKICKYVRDPAFYVRNLYYRKSNIYTSDQHNLLKDFSSKYFCMYTNLSELWYDV